MATEPLQSLSPQDFLAFEREAETKHEYAGGEVLAMTGASERHNLIVANLIAGLHSQMVDRPCRVYPSDMRVAVSASGPFYYPDIVALCAAPRFLDEEDDTLLNPSVLVEVLSPSTEAFVRGPKFSDYRTIESVQEIVIVAQDAMRVEHFARQDDGHWLLTDHASPESVLEIPAVRCRLELARVYAKTEL